MSPSSRSVLDRITTGKPALLVLAALTIVIRLPLLRLSQPIDDEVNYSVVARQLMNGGLLYVDVVERRPPLTFWLYSAVFKVFGEDNWLALHAVATEVSLIVARLAGDARSAPAKLERSLDGSLRHLDDHLDEALAALPAPRLLSFLEVAVFCLVTHLPFRKIRSVDGHPRLVEFCRRFGARSGARATEYAFDHP